MSLVRIREAVGRIWGQATTMLLALAIAVQPVLQALDPTIAQRVPWLPWVLLGLAVGIPVLRILAPPPPSVPIHIDDQVVVQDDKTVTITKATAVPAGITDKVAGQPMEKT